MKWLPVQFVHPERVDLPTGHHMRPIRGDDIYIDYPAVMGSQTRLWSIFGAEWGWPPETMTVEEDHADLIRHEREIAAHESFNYCILDQDGTRLLGCIYIDPPDDDDDTDAVVCWWVIDAELGSDLDRLLDTFVPDWLKREWPFANPQIGLAADPGR